MYFETEPTKRAHSLPLLGLAALSVWLAGCAGANGPSGERSALASDCIINRGIRDFDVLDDRNLIIYGPGNAAYRVEMATPSNFLRGEFAIGIYDEDGRICPYGGDAIIIEGPLTEQIPIRDIEGLSAVDIEALKVEYGIIEDAGDAVSVTEIQ